MVLDIPHDLIGSSGVYNSSDPFLRRLRLDDANGASITDQKRAFADTTLLVLYAGSLQGAHNLKGLHQQLSNLAIREKSIAVVYVSTDTDTKSFLAATAGHPWLRMTFYDDSDFAPLAAAAGAEVTEVSRGEEFVQAGEIELGAETIAYGDDEDPYSYVRPLSRAAVAISMQAFATPSLAVYHLPTHQFVARNVRPDGFQPPKLAANLKVWRRGEHTGFDFGALFWSVRWPLFLLFLSVLYQLVVMIGGDQYHVLPGVIDKFSWRMRQMIAGPQL